MGTMAQGQQDVFNARLQRIQTGSGFTSGQLLVGAAEQTATIKVKKQRESGGWLTGFLMLPVAAAIGVIAMMAGRVGAYHLVGPGADPSLGEVSAATALTADIGIAALLLIMFGWAFRLGRGIRWVAMIAGVVGVMLAEPLILQQAPEFFTALFSETYVADRSAQDVNLSFY